MSAAVGAHEGVPSRAVILDYVNQFGFCRCILHVETIEMDQLFIPVEVTYHVNHLVAKGIEQVFFSKEKCSSTFLIIYTSELLLCFKSMVFYY